MGESDIPTRIAAVEATNMSDLLANQEFRDSVFIQYCVRGVPVEGCVMMQYPLFAKLLEVSIVEKVVPTFQHLYESDRS